MPRRRSWVWVGLSLSFAAGARADHAGEEVALTGPLSVVLEDDFAAGRTRARAWLGEGRELHALDVRGGELPSGVESGARVRVTGELEESGTVIVQAGRPGTIQLLAPRPRGGEVAAAPAAQRTLVILLSFQDRPLDPRATVAAVRDELFGSDPGAIDPFYRWASGERVSFQGDVVGPFTIPFSATGSDYWGWGYAADDAAAAAGVDVGAWPRRVYVLPPNGTGYGGLGTMFGSPSRAWVFYWDARSIYAHELGHNLGLHHASTPTLEYGDQSSVMGSGGEVGFNAPQKSALGWIPSERVRQGVTGGTFELTATAEPLGDLQALSLPIAGSGDALWVSYRNATGYDQALPSGYLRHVSVHRWNGDPASRTYLLATLAPGQSFVDRQGQVSVTLLAEDGVRATVSVASGARAGAPRITAARTLLAAPGPAARDLVLTVVDGDSPVSPAATFDVRAMVPAGWSATVTPERVTLDPGASATVTLSVTPAADPEGAWPVRVELAGPAPEHRAALETTFFIDRSPPTAPAALVASSLGKTLHLEWAAGDDAAGSGVVRYLILRDGADEGESGSTVFEERLAKGRYTFEVVAEDAAGNRSPASAALRYKHKKR